MKAITKLIILNIIGVAIAAIMAAGLVKSEVNNVSLLNAEVRQSAAQLNLLKQQLEAFKTAQADLAKAAQKDQIAKAIVARENLVQPILAIEKAAQITKSKEDLRINEVAADDKVKPVPVITDKHNVAEVPYELSVISDFAGTINFLRLLEHLPQFTEIYKLDLSAETIEGTRPNAPIHTGNILSSIKGVFIIRQP